MEEQLTAGLAEGQISKLVDDDEIVAQQLLRQSPAFADRLFLFQLIDQIDEIVEAPPGARADDRRGDGDAQMGFPVPVPPMKIALRLASRKAPLAISRIWPSSTGVPAKVKLSMSLRTGNLALLIR